MRRRRWCRGVRRGGGFESGQLVLRIMIVFPLAPKDFGENGIQRVHGVFGDDRTICLRKARLEILRIARRHFEGNALALNGQTERCLPLCSPFCQCRWCRSVVKVFCRRSRIKPAFPIFINKRVEQFGHLENSIPQKRENLSRPAIQRHLETDFKDDFFAPDRGFHTGPHSQADGFYE